MKKHITVHEIPIDVEFGSTLKIDWNNNNEYTHSFFKYPCKFIPLIPRWAINKYTQQGDYVIDPFAGSGTTLVESVISGRHALGVDFDNLSRLLCCAKTTPLTMADLHILTRYKEDIANNVIKFKEDKRLLPDIENLSHWFPVENIRALLRIKTYISQFRSNERIYNFLLVCLASIIRKSSLADPASPKPYVSSRIRAHPVDAVSLFASTLNNYLIKITEFSRLDISRCIIIGDDARVINTDEYDGTVKLAVTSPPYINAFDYVRSLRLENAWLGFHGDAESSEYKKKQIGTETISSKEYDNEPQMRDRPRLQEIIKEIRKHDKKRSYVVYRFFMDMEENIKQINRLLKRGGHYIVVIGNCKIRNINVPAHEIIADLALRNGFVLSNMFSYVIQNRYLRIPRSGQGGLIKHDWILVLEKTNG